MGDKLGLVSAEKSLLLHLLYNNDLIPEASSTINSKFFTRESYGFIFRTLEEMYSSSKEISKITLLLEVENKYKKFAEDAEGIVKRIYKPVTTFESCVSMIKEEYVKRTMIEQLNNAIKSLQGNDIEEATNIINKSMETYVGDEQQTVQVGSDAVQNIYDKYMDILENGYTPQGVTILYPSLQLMLESYKPGNLILLSAETGGGKSSFAMNMLYQSSVEQSYKSIYFSLEMTAEEIMEGLMARAGQFNRSRARLGKENETARLKVALNRLKATANNIHIDDRACADMMYIKKRIKQIKMKHGVDIVFIDHAGLISSDKDNIYSSSDFVYNELKRIAKELNVCVVALAQFNRGSTVTKDAEPELHWLKGGSSIEQAADVALMIQNFKDNEYNNDIEVVKLCIKKNRSGGKRNLMFDWNKKTNTFTDTDSLGSKHGIIPIEDEMEQQKIEEIFEEK